MSRNLHREMLCINSVAWAGTLGVVGLVILDVVGKELSWSGSMLGYIFAAVLLGQMFLSGRGLNFGSLVLAAAAGSSPFWFESAWTWFDESFIGLVDQTGSWVAGLIGLFALPVFLVLCSIFAGLMLCAATSSSGVGVQGVLAGFVAGAMTMVPGDRTLIFGAASALWCLILFLSLSKWARNYASRTSRGSGIVCLGQDGPLASLVRGSTHEVEGPRSDAA